MEEPKQYILKAGSGPDVRFTGTLLGELTENVQFIEGSREVRWKLYRTTGGNYIVQRMVVNYWHDVKDFKRPSLVIAYMRRTRPKTDVEDGAKAWSPHSTQGLSEAQMKFLMAAGPEFKAYFVRDVE